MDLYFTDTFENMTLQARNSYADTYTQWCSLDRKLAKIRGDAKGHSNFHLDANLDLILRGIEDEQQEIVKCLGENRGGGAFFLQISLSKMWLLSVYEILRASLDTQSIVDTCSASYFCKNAECFRCSVLAVKQELAHFRVPVAGLEPANDKANKNFHAQIVVSNDHGSVGWRTPGYLSKNNSSDVVSRRELSDLVLSKLEPTAI